MPTPSRIPGRRDARGGIAMILVIALVVVAAAGFAGYWFLIRSDAAAKPTIDDTKVVAGGNANGTWAVAPGDANGYVGYRIHEQFAAGLVDNEATGRTSNVTASMTIQGSKVESVKVSADLATLKSDKDFRDNALHGRGLETDKFPTATFESTAPVDLTAAPLEGMKVVVTVPGKLTLHGVTKQLDAPLTGRWDGRTIQVIGEIPIQLADFGITAPTGGPIAAVDDHGSIELKLFFTKSG